MRCWCSAAFVVGCAVLAALTVPVLFEWKPTPASKAAALSHAAAASSIHEQAQQLPSVAQWLSEVAPTNLPRAAVDGAMLPPAIFSVLFGLASTATAPDLRDTLVRLRRYFRPVVGAGRALST
jgi:Na+/H+-dicarboxylate symporter